MALRIRSGLCVLGLELLAVGSARPQGFLDDLKKSLGGDYTVRGRVQVHSGAWLTCFNGNNTGYLGSANLARPGDAQVDPATGKMRVTTAAIPTFIVTRSGVVTPNDCDSLAQQGLLVPGPSAPGAAGATANADTGYSDGLDCIDPSWTKDEVVRRKREIMDCQSDAVTERAAQRAQQRHALARGQDASSNAAAQRKLEDDTKARFAAIQSQAGTPAPAPAAQSDEDLAWDGAKLCGLKPAYMMKLKDEAVRFVRYDKPGGRIVLSEMAGGARRDVAMDGNAFAQRVSFNASAIGQGGDHCGRAFWNAQAYKAASAAMSGG